MNPAIDIEIDALTESVVEISTGKIYKTHVSKATLKFLNTIHKKNGWKFNWKKEEKEINRLIYKLVLKSNKSILLGLISFETKEDHVHIHLVEKTQMNLACQKNMKESVGIFLRLHANIHKKLGLMELLHSSQKRT